MKLTSQEGTWSGDFGKDYTDRNPHTKAELDTLYEKRFGTTRTALNKAFLADLSVKSILEVGANIGTQLRTLQKAGFSNLVGLELQIYALQEAKKLSTNIDFVQGSAFSLPFADKEFDLVFTSGVLIHLSPTDLNKALDEINRCAKQYIWGFEYFADKYQSVPYRGRDDLLWKGNFAQCYLDRYSDLELVKERRLPYVGESNVDAMFLLKRV